MIVALSDAWAAAPVAFVVGFSIGFVVAARGYRLIRRNGDAIAIPYEDRKDDR